MTITTSTCVPVTEIVPFSDCSEVPFKIEIDTESVFIYESDSGLMSTDSDQQSCASLRVRAIHQGHCTVTASYSHGQINLKSTITIAAFDPLIVSVLVLHSIITYNDYNAVTAVNYL